MRLLSIRGTRSGGLDTAYLERANIQVSTACSSAELSSLTKSGKFDVILSVLPLAEEYSETIVESLGELRRETPIVFYDPDDSIRGTNSLPADLRDCPVLPRIPSSRLVEILRNAGKPAAARAATRQPWEEHLVGESAAMRTVRQTIRLIGPRRATVLITGETGTGKDVVARAIHMASPRAGQSMVATNCGAIPHALMEAELFGHTKGAFTGAVSSRIGRFEMAHRGTLFLDEIGELPLELQPKLLRALQEREIQPVGGDNAATVDIRLIAATNQDLHVAMEQKRFREDLYYRINVVPLHIPALRERLSDIPLLVEHFLEKICRQEGMPLRQVGKDTLDHLTNYSWPGNVRELEHVVEKSIVLSNDRRQLNVADFPLRQSSPKLASIPMSLELPGSGLDFEDFMVKIQRYVLTQALDRTAGNKARAAQILGMKRSTLLSKVKALEAVS